MDKTKVCKELLETIKERNVKDKSEFRKIKFAFAKENNLARMPKDSELLLVAKDWKDYRNLLSIKPVRTISGVAPIAIMIGPIPCPEQAKCIYCPGGPRSPFGDVPKSYTGNEPASMRAKRNKYDSYLQVMNRLEQYIVTRHNPEKVEFIFMGGTYMSTPKLYKENFAKYAYKALNDFSDLFFKDGEFDQEKFNEVFELPADIRNESRIDRIHEKLLKIKGACDLETEKKRNENSKIKASTFCIETRPDVCYENDIDEMLRFGVTRVELGVQTVYDNVQEITKRGHTVKDSVEAIQRLKDSFFKVGYHIMIGLPGSSKEMDVKMMKEIFTNQDYMPDALKVYPTLVMPGTELEKIWKEGKYNELNNKDAIEILLELKRNIRKFCRIMRIQRDIPTRITLSGVDKTNFRQYLHEEMIKQGIKCICIRCREPKNKEVDYSNVKLVREAYKASRGEEIFLSYEDVKNNILLGFLRLRIPYKPYRKEITSKSAGVRELHVYGKALGVGEKPGVEIQHRGYGAKLIEEAEKIAKEEFDCNKLVIISGVGVRNYFYNLGYGLEGDYVSKWLL